MNAGLVGFSLGLTEQRCCERTLVLLLLDYWPARPLASGCLGCASCADALGEGPFFCLAAAARRGDHFLVQSTTHAVVQGLPLYLRLCKSVVAYAKYLGQTLWPVNLCGLLSASQHPLPFSNDGTLGSRASEQWPAPG